MAPFAADVPFGDLFGVNVVADGVAAVARWAGRALHVVRRVQRRPPVPGIADEVFTPFSRTDFPLNGQREVVVADLGEVPLFPEAAVYERHLLRLEREYRVRGQVGEERRRRLSRIADDVGHRRLLPAAILVSVTSLASPRADVVCGRSGFHLSRLVFLAGESFQRADEQHDLPDVHRLVRAAPGGHSGERHAVLDDVVQFAVGERLRPRCAEVRRPRVQAATYRCQSAAVVGMATGALCQKLVPAGPDVVRSGLQRILLATLATGNRPVP